MRLFIAVNIDPSLRPLLAQIQTTLTTTAATVSWVKPDNLHFTLKFLGEVAEVHLPGLRETLQGALVGVVSFALSLGGLGSFPPRGMPRVVWVGVEQGGTEMEELQRRIDEALHSLGFPREARPFRPHLTLGRVKSVARLEVLLACLKSAGVGHVGRMRVGCVNLMQSQLHRGGSIYTSVEAVSLAEGP